MNMNKYTLLFVSIVMGCTIVFTLLALLFGLWTFDTTWYIASAISALVTAVLMYGRWHDWW